MVAHLVVATTTGPPRSLLGRGGGRQSRPYQRNASSRVCLLRRHVRLGRGILLTSITADNGDNCLRPGLRVFQLGQVLVALQIRGSGVRLSTT